MLIQFIVCWCIFRAEADISATDITNMVNAFNTNRSNVSPTATNMVKVKWNTTLATYAQTWSAGCLFKHSSTEPYTFWGQNLFSSSIKKGTTTYDPVISIKSWDSEVAAFTYPTSCSSTACGHYTQDVWATTTDVGCGLAFCVNAENTVNDFLIITCHYWPRGNGVGNPPYLSGTPCSACPSQYPVCSSKLCSTSDASRFISGYVWFFAILLSLVLRLGQ